MAINYLLPFRCLLCAELVAEKQGFCHECWPDLDFISQPYCQVCGAPFGFSSYSDFTCAKCIASPPIYDMARSLMRFNIHSKKIIHHFKYHDRTLVANILVGLIYHKYQNEISKADLIIPVPMNKWKRLLRMYNQAHLLANSLAQLSAKPIYPEILVKSKWTKPQASLSKRARERNLYGSIYFQKKYRELIKGSNIVLVDDVITTGTTVKICSKILKRAGAKTVIVLSIAMT